MNTQSKQNSSAHDGKPPDHASPLPDAISTRRGEPGFIFFNRAGEPLKVNTFDQRHLETGSGHSLCFGPTRSGKCSSTSVILQGLQDGIPQRQGEA